MSLPVIEVKYVEANVLGQEKITCDSLLTVECQLVMKIKLNNETHIDGRSQDSSLLSRYFDHVPNWYVFLVLVTANGHKIVITAKESVKR